MEEGPNEKAENAKWAEEDMRQKSKAGENRAANEEGRSRRRRSESLQREDEEAMMAELAAEKTRCKRGHAGSTDTSTLRAGRVGMTNRQDNPAATKGR